MAAYEGEEPTSQGLFLPPPLPPKKKKNDDIRREMESWKPATEAAMERHARFIARLNAQDVREESATTSGST